MLPLSRPRYEHQRLIGGRCIEQVFNWNGMGTLFLAPTTPTITPDDGNHAPSFGVYDLCYPGDRPVYVLLDPRVTVGDKR